MQLLASDMCPKPGTQVSCPWVMGFMHDPLWGPPTREAKLGHWFLQLRSQPAIVWQPVLSSQGQEAGGRDGGAGLRQALEAGRPRVRQEAVGDPAQEDSAGPQAQKERGSHQERGPKADASDTPREPWLWGLLRQHLGPAGDAVSKSTAHRVGGG